MTERGPLRVLLIEDDEDDYLLTSAMLQEVKGTSYSITWISRYADALDRILAADQDVCLIDYRLGEGTGIELVCQATAAGGRVPMILLTGQGDQETDIEATNAGAADYLVKGEIEPMILERTIRFAIAQARTLETLRESETRFRSVVESANDAIILLNRTGEIISWNQSAESIFGYSQRYILGKRVSTLFPATYTTDGGSNDDRDPMIASQVLHPGTRAIEFDGQRQDGSQFPLEISLSSWETSDGLLYSGIVRDITERKSFEDQLTHQALHDPLTKLANRVLFHDRVKHAIDRIGRRRTGVAVLFLDLDNFKSVNDTLGHALGDDLLTGVTERLKACLRSSDTPARLGGDEFAVLVEDTENMDEAIAISERILSVLSEQFLIGGQSVYTSTSIGIAMTATGQESPEELLRNADVAMYSAKSNGKNRYTVFESNMRDALLKRVAIETDMRVALENNGFDVVYQPIVDLRSAQIIGLEALARWEHPTYGPISPLDFIPIAEECGLIIPLGKWILEQSCRWARQWQDMYEFGDQLSITVNISTRQLQDDRMLETVSQALAESGLPPNSLVLEITEGTMLDNAEATIERLTKLKSLGVRLAIDDFGTGYSSLSYLQQFPIDILKIDKSFIDKIQDGKEGSAFAKAIITMSDALHLKTIAEGIENLGQSVELQQLGCEYGQGFHFAKPLSPEDLGRLLSASASFGVELVKGSRLISAYLQTGAELPHAPGTV